MTAMRRYIVLASALLSLPVAGHAQDRSPATVTPAPLTTATYKQNFDTLANTGTSAALPAGFQIVETGTGAAADGLYAAGTGSSNAGNLYSFGASGSTDRALGSLASGGVAELLYGALFTNQLGGTITSLAFSYRGEQWRSGASTDDRLTFEFSTNATQINAGTFTEVAALNFVPLVTNGNFALDGNANFRLISGLISGLSIAQGSTFAFRFRDIDSAGSDNGLAIDNLSFTATLAPVAGAVPEPSTWALMLLGFGAVGASLRRKRAVLRLA
jgi:hypothetical protein